MTNGQQCTEFKVIAGRTLVCTAGKLKGKEVISIHKGEGFSPTRADAMVRYLEHKLNKHKDFEKFYNKHMGG